MLTIKSISLKLSNIMNIDTVAGTGTNFLQFLLMSFIYLQFIDNNLNKIATK